MIEKAVLVVWLIARTIQTSDLGHIQRNVCIWITKLNFRLISMLLWCLAILSTHLTYFSAIKLLQMSLFNRLYNNVIQKDAFYEHKVCYFCFRLYCNWKSISFVEINAIPADNRGWVKSLYLTLCLSGPIKLASCGHQT